MATVRDLLKGSMRLIGAVATGETPTADEQADGLVALNDLLESWSIEKLFIYNIVREEFTLTGNTANYTIGSSGDFNTSRPLRIENAAIEDQSASPTIEYPLEIMNSDQWAKIQVKDQAATIPTRVYMDDNYPLATISLWPVPTAANKIVLYSWKPITAFASVGTSISFPPGYARALRYNLAIDLATEYGKQVSPDLADVARDAKAAIKRMNIKPPYVDCDLATQRRVGFNIYIGS